MWKWKVGDAVRMKNLKYVPKFWRNKPAIVVDRYVTITSAGYRNYWYVIEDAQYPTGKRKRGVLAERLKKA